MINVTGDISHSHLDTDVVPSEARFAMFRQTLGGTHDVLRNAGDTRPFRAQLDVWLLGGMAVTSGFQTGARIVRTAERIRADGLDHLTFMHLREGSVSGTVGGPMEAGAGETFVLDLRRPFDLETSDNWNVGVRLSRETLGRFLRPMPDLHGAVLKGTPALVVADHFASLVRHLPTVPGHDAAVVARATAALIGTCIDNGVPHPAGPKPNGGTSLRQRVVHHIDSNLTSPTLTTTDIIRALNVSRSNLYRAFQDEGGGVAGFIRARRLDAVLARLTDPDETRGIADLAYAFGFVSDTHFSRIFRRRFGLTPSEARSGAGSPTAATGGEPSVNVAYRVWLKGLVDGPT